MAVSSFSNPLVEQRELLAGESAVELDKKIITVAGDERLTWLHALLSQNLNSLKPGDSAEALLLDPQGHVDAVVNVIDDGRTTFLIVEDVTFEKVFEHLKKMKLRTRVEISTLDGYKVFATFNQPLENASLVWSDPWPNVVAGGHRYSSKPVDSWNYWESVAAASNLGKAGTEALTALRILALRPWFQDVDEKTLPHELDWLTTAVHLSKGCYRGQEAVAKIHNLGHPPRRLVLLHLDGIGHTLPKAGEALFSAGVEVGKVTSAATHFESGPIALAVVRRNLDENSVLVTETGIAANAETVVPVTAGKTVTIDRKSLMGGRR